MTFFDEEIISLSTDLTAATLSRAKIFQAGVKANLARVCNRSASTGLIVLYRFGGAPVLETSFELAWGESFDVKGTENLAAVQFRVRDAGNGTGTLYVAYAK